MFSELLTLSGLLKCKLTHFLEPRSEYEDDCGQKWQDITQLYPKVFVLFLFFSTLRKRGIFPWNCAERQRMYQVSGG